MSSTTTLSSTSTSTSTATATCISVTPDKNGYVPEWACGANYNFYPNFGAAIFFSVAFGLSLFIHIFQTFYHKKIRLSWVIIMGTAWEFASFVLRAAGAKDQQSVPFAYVSQVLFLLAPMWINAFDYMVMGRMIYFFVPEQKIWNIKGVKIAKIFVCLDILSFLTQLVGGVMIQPGGDQASVMRGIHIYMGGIGIQELFILIFTSVAIKFHLEMRKQERSLADSTNRIIDGRPRSWRMLLYVLYASLVLITIRIIFRMIEFASGMEPEHNPIPFHEAYQLALDALPMLAACVLMNIVHPGRVLRGEGSEFKRLTRAEKKEMKRVKKEEKQAKKDEKKAIKEQKKTGRMMESSDGTEMV